MKYLIMILICISLIPKEIKHVFMFYSENCLLIALAYFFIDLFGFFVFNLRHSLYWILIQEIASLSLWFDFFHSLYGAFYTQKSLILMEWNIAIYLFLLINNKWSIDKNQCCQLIKNRINFSKDQISSWSYLRNLSLS